MKNLASSYFQRQFTDWLCSQQFLQTRLAQVVTSSSQTAVNQKELDKATADYKTLSKDKSISPDRYGEVS